MFAMAANAQIPQNGLMGHYNFNNSNTRDTSANKRHTYGGFNFGTDRNGNVNSCYASGRCGIAMPTPNGGGMSIACWVKFAPFSAQTAEVPTIASSGVFIFDNNNNQLGYIAKYLLYGQKATNDSFSLRFDMYYGATGFNALGVGIDCGKLLKANEWHHIAVAHNNSDSSVNWYVDGKFINKYKLLAPFYYYPGQARTEDNYDVIGDLIIGGCSRGIFNGVNRLVQGSIYAHNSFIGSIDEFLIYDRGLSAGEVNNIYTNAWALKVGTIKEKTQLNVHPNPAKDYIDFNQPSKNIRVFSITGIEIKTGFTLQDNKFRMDISALSKGMYVLQIDNESIRFVKE